MRLRTRSFAHLHPCSRPRARAVAAALALASATAAAQPHPGAAPADSLVHAVVALDSTLFAAYNGCDLATLGGLAAEDLEFYHDQTGLARGRRALVDAVRENVCGKVRRDVVPGTLAVYPLRGYGAVETGEHRFCDPRRYRTCPAAAGGAARFVMLWRQEPAGGWQLARVVSYDHAPRTDDSPGAAAPPPTAAPATTAAAPPLTSRTSALADALDARAPGWLARSRVPSLAVAYVAEAPCSGRARPAFAGRVARPQGPAHRWGGSADGRTAPAVP